MNENLWDDSRITAYVLDELSGEQRSRFEDELKQNEKLAAAVDEARAITGRVAMLFGEESTPPLDDERRSAILSATAGRPEKPAFQADAPASPRRPFSWPVLAVTLATAATLLVIVGVATWPQAAQRLSSGKRFAPGSPGVEARAETEAAVNGRLAAGVEYQLAPLPEPVAVPPADVADETVARLGESRLRRSGPVAAPARPASDRAESPSADDAYEFAFGDTRDRSSLSTSTSGSTPQSLESQSPQSLESPEFDATSVRTSVRGRTRADSGGLGGLGGGLPEALPEEVERSIPLGLPPGPTGGSFANDSGQGPGMAGDRFDPITDNPFRRVAEHPLSTFSIDVDTASYAKVRDFVLRAGQRPRPDAVRIEELVNYFDYGYEPPGDDASHPFGVDVTLAECPWNADHRLARVSLQGKRLDPRQRPQANLVFLIDTSGSMNAPNRLPLVRWGLLQLLDQLRDDDRVAIVVYAGSAGRVLDSTPVGERDKIRRSLTALAAGGSTNGGQGISLAYQTARDHFIPGGVNRVILCTDGDFNVGTTGTDSLVRLVEEQARGGVFLTVLGFGMGNHNDAMLEQISGRGNGNYAFIDSEREARKVLVEQVAGTLVTIAKDVKVQIEFNPRRVGAYRLIGYENRVLAKEDFNDDRKDAGEIGAGHSVTAFYELVPAGRVPDASPPAVDDLRYQTAPDTTSAAEGEERMTVKFRYKRPDEDNSILFETVATGDGVSFSQADPQFRFAAAVAGFGMQLRNSPYAGNWTLADVRRAAEDARSEVSDGRSTAEESRSTAEESRRRAELMSIVDRVIELTATERDR